MTYSHSKKNKNKINPVAPAMSSAAVTSLPHTIEYYRGYNDGLKKMKDLMERGYNLELDHIGDVVSDFGVAFNRNDYYK